MSFKKIIFFLFFFAMVAVASIMRYNLFSATDNAGVLNDTGVFAGFPFYGVLLAFFLLLLGSTIFLKKTKHSFFYTDFDNSTSKLSLTNSSVIYLVVAFGLFFCPVPKNVTVYTALQNSFNAADKFAILLFLTTTLSAIAILFKKLPLGGILLLGSAIFSVLTASRILGENLIIKRDPRVLIIFLSYSLLSFFYLSAARVLVVRKPPLYIPLSKIEDELEAKKSSEYERKVVEKDYIFRATTARSYMFVTGLSASGLVISSFLADLFKGENILIRQNFTVYLLPQAVMALGTIIALSFENNKKDNSSVTDNSTEVVAQTTETF